MPYTTHQFYTVTYNQSDDRSARGKGWRGAGLALCLKLSSPIISDLRLEKWLSGGGGKEEKKIEDSG